MKLKRFILTSLTLFSFISYGQDQRKIVKLGEKTSYKDIPKNYYDNTKANREIDPFNKLVEGFRKRKVKDLMNPNFPQPFKNLKNIPSEYVASGKPWADLEQIFRWNWTSLKNTANNKVTMLKKAVKARYIFNHPDFKIIEIAIGSGGILPRFKGGAPSAIHILGGEGEIEVGEVKSKVSPGISVKIEPNTSLKIKAESKNPLKLIFFSWAPNGRQDYLDAGYYLTGANFYAQPIEATMPDNFEFWNDVDRRKNKATGIKNKKEVLYPETPIFSNEVDIPWIDFTNLEGQAFFWAKDASSAGELLSIWNKIVRMKGIFQAKVPNKQYDFNFSYIANGPHAKYITHSHATPEFYYVLGGNIEWIIEGKTYHAKPGNLYFHSPYQNHEMLGLKDNIPMVAITGSWAPFGDRSVFEKELILLEPLPVQAKSSYLSDNFNFHNFNLKTDLKFPTLN